ncbi:hypothetical protein C8E97_6557 [Saccharothrix australiensis]|uniref:Uncharacterized protein n=1 Tax=Saccharothrix australiensis TaxID=2072 RepID=A0A495W9K0_9PSEU|nr:hypothetical protein C8E97_6557 [Saccharothrix australiensis]
MSPTRESVRDEAACESWLGYSARKSPVLSETPSAAGSPLVLRAAGFRVAGVTGIDHVDTSALLPSHRRGRRVTASDTTMRDACVACGQAGIPPHNDWARCPSRRVGDYTLPRPVSPDNDPQPTDRVKLGLPTRQRGTDHPTREFPDCGRCTRCRPGVFTEEISVKRPFRQPLQTRDFDHTRFCASNNRNRAQEPHVSVVSPRPSPVGSPYEPLPELDEVEAATLPRALGRKLATPPPARAGDVRTVQYECQRLVIRGSAGRRGRRAAGVGRGCPIPPRRAGSGSR